MSEEKPETKIVKFYAPETGCWWLSNFYPAPFEVDDVVWPSSEHYYQALKVDDAQPSTKEEIRKASTPKKAKEISHGVGDDRTVAEKVEFMRQAIRRKFEEHPDLRLMLVATGDAIIIEASLTDEFWGWGRYGHGINMMGLLLMELRSQFRQLQPTATNG